MKDYNREIEKLKERHKKKTIIYFGALKNVRSSESDKDTLGYARILVNTAGEIKFIEEQLYELERVSELFEENSED